MADCELNIKLYCLSISTLHCKGPDARCPAVPIEDWPVHCSTHEHLHSVHTFTVCGHMPSAVVPVEDWPVHCSTHGHLHCAHAHTAHTWHMPHVPSPSSHLSLILAAPTHGSVHGASPLCACTHSTHMAHAPVGVSPLTHPSWTHTWRCPALAQHMPTHNQPKRRRLGCTPCPLRVWRQVAILCLLTG